MKKRVKKTHAKQVKKRIFALLVSAATLASSAYAANKAAYTDGTVTISGEGGAGKRVSLVLFKSDEGVQAGAKQIEQKNADSQGAFNFEFPFKPDGDITEYKVLLNDGENAETLSIEEVNYKFSKDFELFKVDDCIKPNTAFCVYGEGLESAELYVLPISTQEEADYDGKNKTKLEVVNADNEFLQALFPEDFEAGAYAVWARKGIYVTQMCYINKSRPQWLSENVVSSGNFVTLTGRNLDAREWNCSNATQIKLKSADGDEYFAQTGEVNPYAAKFTVGEEVPEGEYSVLASNDGVLWSKLENGEKLTVVKKCEDRFELGVAWADKFEDKREFDITDYRKLISLLGDYTNAIQGAIDAAEKAGGGIVTIPEGEFKFTKSITAGDNVVLKGAGKDKTKLVYSPNTLTTNETTLKNAVALDFAATNGMQGIANLTLTVDSSLDQKYIPDMFIRMGQNGCEQYSDQRTAQYGFLKNVGLVYPKDSPVAEENDGRWDNGRIAVNYKSHFVVDGCGFSGYHANITSSYIGKYLAVTNNTVDTTIGCFYIYSQYGIFENNSFTRLKNNSAALTNAGTQGIYTRSDNYIANCRIINTGNKSGDGEILAAESMRGGTKMYGTVESAEGLEIKVNPKTNAKGVVLGEGYASGPLAWDISKKASGDWYIVIIGGRGTGQYRKITAADESTKTVSVDKAWDVVPDATSEFSVVMPLKNITFYNNYAENCRWAMLLYGPTLDCVVADNEMKDTLGIQIHVIQKEAYSDELDYSTEEELEKLDCRIFMAYYNRICRNKLSGVSWTDGICDITVVAKTEKQKQTGLPVLGVSVCENQMTGDNKTPEEILNKWNEWGGEMGYMQGYRNGINIVSQSTVNALDEPPAKAVCIENNGLKDMYSGISLGCLSYAFEILNPQYADKWKNAASGVSVRGNTFENVANEICENADKEYALLTDCAKTEIADFKFETQGDKTFAEVTLKNGENKIFGAKATAAVCGEEGELLNIDFCDVFVQGLGLQKISFPVEFDPQNAKNKKLFLWNGFENLLPLTEIKAN